MACPDGLLPGFGIDADGSAAICYIKSYFGIGPDGLGLYRTGSGALIDSGAARRHVVTAAHNLFHHAVRREAVWVSLWFRRNGDAALATRDAVGWRFPAEFGGAASPPGDRDYGLVRINPLGADRFTGVTLALSVATGDTRKLLVGYPDEGVCKGRAVPYHTLLTVAPSGPDTYLYRDQPTYAGMSGGPLMTRDTATGELRCWGVHSRGGDTETERAIRFSAHVHDEIMGWT